jgi:hypothetical protein
MEVNMLNKFGKREIVVFSVWVVMFILACGALSSSPAAGNPPAFDPTKAALELQATAMSLQLTQSSLGSQQNSQQLPQATFTTIPPTLGPTTTPQPTAVSPTSTQDVEARIKSAKILLYENTDELGIGQWIQDALDGMGLQYTQTGSYSGHFFEDLNSGAQYDLIIVGAEDKAAITGEFWDAIDQRLVRDKAALIVEIWYLNHEANGPINKIMSGCGIRYQAIWNLADSIYWWEPTHPVFNQPNLALPLLHYNRYWSSDAGNLIQLGSGGDATLLAGPNSKKSSAGALIATCYSGRVIFQTFSNHDYNHADIVALWQNYIHYTLKNHFAVVP